MKLTSFIRGGFYSAALGAVALGSVALTSGCATTLSIKSVKPARVFIGSNPQVGITELSGATKELREVVAYQLVRQSKEKGAFLVKERMNEGITFDTQGNEVAMTGVVPVSPSDIFIKVKILDTGAETAKEKRSRSVKTGGQYVTEYYEAEVLDSTAVLAFTVAGPKSVYIPERQYSGKIKEDKNNLIDKTKTIEKAVALSVAHFLDDITPTSIAGTVRMDGGDSAQKQILKLAVAGKLVDARSQLEELSRKSPDNAAALYNLAVLADAAGEYENAIILYDRALSKKNKGYYIKAKQACMERLNTQNALRK